MRGVLAVVVVVTAVLGCSEAGELAAAGDDAADTADVAAADVAPADAEAADTAPDTGRADDAAGLDAAPTDADAGAEAQVGEDGADGSSADDAGVGADADAASPVDAGPEDADLADASAGDAGPADTGPADAGPADTGPADAGPADAGSADAGSADATAEDAGAPDGGMGMDAAPPADGGAAPNVDLVDATCQQPAWLPEPCTAPVVSNPPTVPAKHIDLPTPIVYEQSPPASGPHRPQWAKWGEYDYLPPQRWLHNLEHGGAAFLYHPCAPKATVDALRALAKQQPADAGGPFRWVLTPYPGLPSTVAVVTWDWIQAGGCVQPEATQAFLQAHYRKAPEDVAADGSYAEGWLGK